MLPNKCYLKDIRTWEEKHNRNVLTLFDENSIDNLVLILSIFYSDMPEEELYKMLDTLFESGYSIIKLFLELRDILLGYKVDSDDNRASEDNNEQSIAGTFDDVKQYKYLSDYYMHLCMQLMSLGMSYSEFWSLTTKEMYQSFEAIQQKMVFDFNRQMQIAYNTACLNGAAFAGCLPKQAPQIDIEELHNPDEEIDTPLGRMTRQDYRDIKALEKLY